MNEARYNNPMRKKKGFRPTIACVIPIHVGVSKIEQVGARPRDGKEFPIEENKLELIKFMLACHERYNPGIAYDIIFVDNATRDRDTLEFILDYAHKKDCHILRRQNTGFSFGAYDVAWQEFADQYDYFLFHEQDICPTHDGWLKEIFDKFHSDPEIGAVGNIIEGYRGKEFFEKWKIFDTKFLGAYWNAQDFNQCNLDGMFMFTSTRILRECGLQIYNMKLTDMDNPESWDITPGVNELFWQHHILDHGYKIASFDDGKHACTFGITYVDFPAKDLLLPPMIHTQTIYVSDDMRHVFKWYEKIPKKQIDRIRSQRSVSA